MSKLTDLEICKRVAEIEGVNVDVIGGKAIIDNIIDGVRIRLTEYNPLADDALCFQLMNKHFISLINHETTNGGCYAIWAHSNETPHPCSTSVLTNQNRAICLAIIEANESAK